MSLFALITALLLEQLHPLASRKYLFGLLSGYVNFFQQHFNAGERQHGKMAWLLAVLPLLAGALLLYQMLYRVHPIVAWAFNVLTLYLTMGFRQFSHYFTEIQHALLAGRLDEARRVLSIWRGAPANELNADEVARVTIEEALIASHRNVFGVIAWFVLFSAIGLGGAVGALVYRLALFLRRHWAREGDDGAEDLRGAGSAGNEFGRFARDAFHVLDWVPVRLTAIVFAIVGNFEDTIYCWRTQATSWPEHDAGILLASGAGALGVRLGMPILLHDLPLDRAELGVGDDVDVEYMQSTVGLVWRAVVFWLIMLLLLTLASLVG